MLLQARWSPIDFDYLGYAKLRWEEYRRRKAEFMGAPAAPFHADHTASGGGQP